MDYVDHRTEDIMRRLGTDDAVTARQLVKEIITDTKRACADQVVDALAVQVWRSVVLHTAKNACLEVRMPTTT